MINVKKVILIVVGLFICSCTPGGPAVFIVQTPEGEELSLKRDQLFIANMGAVAINFDFQRPLSNTMVNINQNMMVGLTHLEFRNVTFNHH